MAAKRTKKKASVRKKASTRPLPDKPVILYIHGIGDHPPKDEFKRAWDLALFGRDMQDQTRMAYWADILHGDGAAGGTGKKSIGTRSQPTPLNAAGLLRETGIDPKDPEALAFVQALAESLADPNSLSGTPAERRTRVLPLPGFLRRPVAERLLRWFVKDTAAYFFDKQIRQRIKRRFETEVRKAGDSFLLITHSQGTIIGFEVLSELKGAKEIPLFATMGAPLGLVEVQDLLKRDGFKLRIPNGVQAWHNFADRLDPVALDATLSAEFEPEGRIRDQMVINERTRDLLRFNPHSSVGYLANPAVRSVVHHAFRFDPGSRFVVARDVAEGFAGIEKRQPVLIEALHPGYWALGESDTQLRNREEKQKSSLGQLSGRIDFIGEQMKGKLRRRAKRAGDDSARVVREAKIIKLRKYVSAHLTPEEIVELAQNHRALNVYAVWRSAEKRKLIQRSISATKVDAGRVSYRAEGEGITWAVLDTGARWDHPHFENNHTILEVVDCTTTDDEPVRMADADKADRDGHGTHVAGIIAGEHSGYRGIAPRARLIIYKVLDDHGRGEDAWIIKAIDDVYRRNESGTGLEIHGVNLSLGGPFDATVYGCGHSPICTELRDLWRQGVLVCVAAGNEGQVQVLTQQGAVQLNSQLSIGDPANLEDCIAVGSVNGFKPHLFGTSWFSSRGPTADGRMKPDVVAPGERIESANADFRKSGRGRGSRYEDLYLAQSGTSMACPHVSGMLAAFLSVRREFVARPDEVKRILMENCNDLGRDRYHQGAGLPNLMKMLLNT